MRENLYASELVFYGNYSTITKVIDHKESHGYIVFQHHFTNKGDSCIWPVVVFCSSA